jgi:predicted PurR-regulated permease PerM
MEKLKFKSILLIITYTVVLYMALNHYAAVTGALGYLFGIILPFIYGIAISFVLNIPYQFYREKVFRKMAEKGGKLGRWSSALALLSTYVSVFIGIFLIVWFVIPQLGSSVNQLVQNIPAYLVSVQNIFNDIIARYNLASLLGTQVGSTWTNLMQHAATMLSNMLQGVFGYLIGVTSSIFNILIGFIVSIYMLSGKDSLISQTKRALRAFLPDRWMGLLMRVASKTNYTFGRFIKGTLIDSTVMGILCFIGLSVLGIPYALLVSVIQGTMNIIPAFGPVIGACLSAFIIFMDTPYKALVFLVFILVLQQIDGNFIQPRIVGSAIGLPGLWVIFAVVVGSALFGVVGLVIGVPTVAVGYSLVKELINRRLEEKEKVTEKPEQQ